MAKPSSKSKSSKKAARPKKQAAKKMPVKKAPSKKVPRKPKSAKKASASSKKWTMRIRMFRQGLGDCFLLTFRKKDRSFFHIVIDCGVLMGTEESTTKMENVVKSIADATSSNIDLLIVTHEHWDHLSGFHQAREAWDKVEIQEVWMGWTENPSDTQAKRLSKARHSALNLLEAASQDLPMGMKEGVQSLLQFGGPLGAAKKTTKTALDYLRERAAKNSGVRYLQPGEAPISFSSVPGVRVFTLGPPRDEKLLKKSDAYKKDKADGFVFGLQNEARSLAAAVGFANDEIPPEQGFPFAERLQVKLDSESTYTEWFRSKYESPDATWRKIDDDWLSAFGELALKLDNDTNNTSLVLAFEIEATGHVALFVGDAQIGNWQSWESVTFPVKGPDGDKPLTAHDLIKRTRFYKVGHHCSHNATLKAGGLDLMERSDLVAFIPVHKATAAAQGRKVNGKPKGWEMPAKTLFKALNEATDGRTILSDADERVPQQALDSGVVETELYIEFTI